MCLPLGIRHKIKAEILQRAQSIALEGRATTMLLATLLGAAITSLSFGKDSTAEGSAAF